MLSLLALTFLCLGAAVSSSSLLLASPLVLIGLLLGGAALNRPGDMEWLLGLFLLAGLVGFVIQLGAAMGLWGF